MQVTNNAYIKDGVIYDRVTSAIGIIDKPGLRYWHGKNSNEFCAKVLDEASAIGTGVHNVLEKFVKDEEIAKISPVENRALNSLQTWMKKVGASIKETERTLFDHTDRYAGTFDGRAIIENPPIKYFPMKPANILVDYKTSKKLRNTHILQLSAYLHTYECTENVKLDGAVLLRFEKDMDKKKDYHAKYFTREQLVEVFGVFLAALKLYRWNKGG